MRVLAFDTSNYTTSVAVYDGKNVISQRQILEVKEGMRGLRQSEALFQHIKNLPDIMDRLRSVGKIDAVGVSTRPRNVDGSYMPVFLAGLSFAKTASSVLSVPLYEFSHQEGHIMAGIFSSERYDILEDDFISVHLSGGTTEILKTHFENNRFNCMIIGGSKDISVGQVIDRVGVKFGMKFPCGKEMDRLSLLSDSATKLPVSVKDGYFNLSGLETKATTIADKKENIALGVLEAIAATLIKSLSFCRKKYGIKNILIVGGVASNTILRNRLKNEFENNICFASSEYSTDNAVGIAVLTNKMLGEEA